MRVFKKLIVALVVFITFFEMNYINVNAGENTLIIQKNGEETELTLIKEEVENATYVTGRGYTHTYQYVVEETGQVACRFSMTVGFNYDYADGNARITTFSYEILYIGPGFSMGNINKTTKTVGNPATATLTYKIYYDGISMGTGTSEARCYNSGSIIWY